MQKGGFDIVPLKDSDFKYTVDPNRILWTKNVFPIADYLIDIVLKIPWKSYKFEGDTRMWYSQYDESGRSKFRAAVGYVPLETKVKAEAHKTPFYFFGGCVYEILDRLYGGEPGVPKLRTLVDPTGDLDIFLRLPKITKYTIMHPSYAHLMEQDAMTPYLFEENPPEGEANNLTANNYRNRPGRRRETRKCPPENSERSSKDTRTYNPLIESYTTWIMEQLAKNLMKYKRGGTLWGSLFGNTVPFSIDEDAEGMFADKIICIDNLKIVRSYLPYMSRIKIQLIAKFKGMERSDHICEFLLPMPNTFVAELYEQHGMNNDMEQIQKNIPFSSFKELIKGNESGATDRLSLMNTEIRHKFYNHIMRMAYLNLLMEAIVNKKSERNPRKITLKPIDYSTTMMYLNEYVLFIMDHYFFRSYFFVFDYKMIDTLSVNAITRLNAEPNTPRKKTELLQRLVGNFSKFMMYKNIGSYWFAGGPNYINLLEHTHIQEWIASLPNDVKRSKGIDSMAETLAIKADIFYNLLNDLDILKYE